MGFPEDFALPPNDGLACRLLGNAVCPPLVGAICACVLCALEGRDADVGQCEAADRA